MPEGKLSISSSHQSSKGGGTDTDSDPDPEDVGNSRFQVDKVVASPDDGTVISDHNHYLGGTSGFPVNHHMTYVPNEMTVGQMTEALPQAKHYAHTASVGFEGRPDLAYLHDQSKRQKSVQADDDEDDGPALKGKVIKFGWLEGVLMRCLLNIWGVMLFLRLSWVVGHAGMVEGCLLISLANLVTYVTAFSMSAVSTNGQIKGGGIYYMISRSLGPEFGAAIGLMFTIANSIAVAMYIVGFCESLFDLMEANDWGPIFDGGDNDVRVVGLGVLILILILAFIGMDWVTRAQMFLLVVLIAAQIDFIVGSFLGPQSDVERAKGFTGYKAETWSSNVDADYRIDKDSGDKQSFFSVFGVFFPAVTGIVAGANLSGDLKDPGSAIPKGTLLAITITYISYLGYALMMGGCVLREVNGDVDAYRLGLNATAEWLADNPQFVAYTNCTDSNCDYGLLNSAQVMELVSSWGPLIYMGCFAATLSSAIASLVGAPRVFQALAKDKLYPFIHFFAQGYGANNDPVRGYLLVFAISLGCIAIADLNAIAPLLSNFFLAAYCLINFSVFHATITKSPGWRPSFKYYNAWISLLGSLLCIAVMFLLSWPTALITVGVSVFLYLYVSYQGPDVNWGSSTQAQAYKSSLSSLQNLNSVEEHVKNYRPQILVLSGAPSVRPPLIDFSYLVVKNVSLLICGHVMKNRSTQQMRNHLSRQAYSWLAKNKKKGFYIFIEDENFERGARGIMQTAGLGKLRPNTVMMGYKKDWLTCDRQELKDYFSVMHEALDMHLAVTILRVKEGLDYSNLIDQNSGMEEKVKMTKEDKKAAQLEKKRFKKEGKPLAANYKGPGGTPLSPQVLASLTQFQGKQVKGTIDVYWLYDDGGLTILLPYILSTRSQFVGCKLRIFTLSSRKDELGQAQINMAALLAKFRIEYSDVIVIPDVTAKAQPATKQEFEAMIAPFKNDEPDSEGTSISTSELNHLREKTNRHLRLREILQKHSMGSTFVVMTLPVPRKGTVSAPLYMAWLEIMTKGMPPFLLVRGNQTSVLTFYS